jgi:hypothetical protein
MPSIHNSCIWLSPRHLSRAAYRHQATARFLVGSMQVDFQSGGLVSGNSCTRDRSKNVATRLACIIRPRTTQSSALKDFPRAAPSFHYSCLSGCGSLVNAPPFLGISTICPGSQSPCITARVTMPCSARPSSGIAIQGGPCFCFCRHCFLPLNLVEPSGCLPL